MNANDLTSEQMLQLMEASAKKYISMDAKIKFICYQKDEKSAQRIIKRVCDITSRWTQDRKYWKISQTEYSTDTTNGPETQKEITTYAVHPQWSKYLTEVPNKAPKGDVRSGGITILDRAFPTVYLAMWDNVEMLWKTGVNLSDMNLNYDDINNLYEWHVRVGTPNKGPIFKFYIDPTKDFIPVKTDSFKGDVTTLVNHSECGQFRKINNVWIPHKFSSGDSRVNWYADYEYEVLSVNTPIDEKLLDFVFPKGTIVTMDYLF